MTRFDPFIGTFKPPLSPTDSPSETLRNPEYFTFPILPIFDLGVSRFTVEDARKAKKALGESREYFSTSQSNPWMTAMRTRALIAILTLNLAGPVLASDAGTTAAEFLNLGAGPRAVAMGDAQVGLASDVYANYWNPAGLSTLKTQEAAFTQTQYVQNISQEYLAYALPRTLYGSFGAASPYQGYGSFSGYDAAGSPTGSVGASDMNLGLSYSRDLFYDERYGTELSAGVTGKWIREDLAEASATSFAGDLGLLFSPGIKWGEALNGWKEGLALRNVGTPITFDQESFALPRMLATGLFVHRELAR